MSLWGTSYIEITIKSRGKADRRKVGKALGGLLPGPKKYHATTNRWKTFQRQSYSNLF